MRKDMFANFKFTMEKGMDKLKKSWAKASYRADCRLGKQELCYILWKLFQLGKPFDTIATTKFKPVAQDFLL